MTIDEKLTCILGPNEVGKTSFLDAVSRLRDQTPFQKEGPKQDTSRGIDLDDDHYILSALFLVEPNDIKNLLPIKGVNNVRFFEVKKKVNGQRDYRVYPEINDIDNFPKRMTGLILDPDRRPKWLDSFIQSNQELKSQLEEHYNKEGDEDSVMEMNIVNNQTVELILRLIRNTNSEEVELFASELKLLSFIQKRKGVTEAITDHLYTHTPSIELFASDQLQLQSDYNLASYFPGDKKKNAEKIPQSLINFAALCGLSLETASHYAKIDDAGALRTILDEANRNLRAHISENWTQYSLQVRVTMTGQRLTILAGSDGIGLEKLAVRSEGLRQFIALMSFLHSSGIDIGNAVLLIDEIEKHLHYDAQADLVQMLAKQDIVPQIVFTTHSIGCLPEDLGNGVRVLRLDREKSGSIVDNKFWSQNEPGLSPLIVGMGAATMAFLPTRNCVLTEGPADFLLYPSIFREATKRNPLGFQFSPGLAVASPEGIKLMQADGKGVLHLVDGDQGGKVLRKQLTKAGIDDSLIFDLSHLGKEGLQLEDLIEPRAFVKAVNSELEKSGIDFRAKVSDLAEIGRWDAFLDRLEHNKVSRVPDKVSIAYNIIGLRGVMKIVNKKYEVQLRNLYREMKKAL